MRGFQTIQASLGQIRLGVDQKFVCNGAEPVGTKPWRLTQSISPFVLFPRGQKGQVHRSTQLLLLETQGSILLMCLSDNIKNEKA